jgi:hypothetical protein
LDIAHRSKAPSFEAADLAIPRELNVFEAFLSGKVFQPQPLTLFMF